MSCWSFYRTHYGDFLSVLLLINTTAAQCLAPYTTTTTIVSVVSAAPIALRGLPFLWTLAAYLPINGPKHVSHVVVVALLRGQSKCKNCPVDHFGGLPGVSHRRSDSKTRVVVRMFATYHSIHFGEMAE